MKTNNPVMPEALKTMSEAQMSVQRVTPSIDGVPCQDEICFLVSGYSVRNDIELEELVLLPISEAKRLIGILEMLTKNENEHIGINPLENESLTN